MFDNKCQDYVPRDPPSPGYQRRVRACVRVQHQERQIPRTRNVFY